MPQLDNSLPPGLAGFMATRQANQQADQGNLANITGITGILAKLQAAQREQELREALASGDTARLAKLPGGLAILQKMATMKNAEITGRLNEARITESGTTGQLNAARLADLRSKSVVSGQEQQAKGALANLLSSSGSFGQGTDAERPNAQVFMNDAEAIRAMQEAEASGRPFTGNVPKPGNVRGLAIAAGGALPRGATSELLKQLGPQKSTEITPYQKEMLRLRQAQIDKPPAPAVNVYSGSLTAGVDAEGRPIFVQPSGRPDTPPRKVEGVFPPERVPDAKARLAAEDAAGTAANVRKRVESMAKLIQSGSVSGGVVGPLGVAGRIAETAQGVIDPNAKTPALDYQNEMRLLLSDVRKLVEKDPNLSKDEREALYETLGGGIFQTPGSAIRSLSNVLAKVENAAVTGKSRGAKIEDSVKAAGWDYEPAKYEYRVVDGKVQRKARQ